MEAVIYCRFSPRRDEEESESLAQQSEFCMEHANKMSIPVKVTCWDRAISGKTLDRPGLWQALDLLDPGDILLVYKLDRLARDVYGSFCIEEAVRRKNARIVSANGEGTWHDSPEDRLVRNILRTLNQYNREVTALRTKHAMRRHILNMRRMSSKDPIGYQMDPKDCTRMVVNEKEQAALAYARKLRAQGKGWNGIAKELNRYPEDFPPRGRKWQGSTLMRVLKPEEQQVG